MAAESDSEGEAISLMYGEGVECERPLIVLFMTNPVLNVGVVNTGAGPEYKPLVYLNHGSHDQRSLKMWRCV